MNDKYFIDTNVFVYSFDSRYPKKQKKAQALIEQALEKQIGVISTQVIQEFCNVATKKFEHTFSVPDLHLLLEKVFHPLCEIFPTVSLYAKALSFQDSTRYSFYDSLILVSALEAKCRFLISEDLQDEQKIDQLTIKNPFHRL